MSIEKELYQAVVALIDHRSQPVGGAVAMSAAYELYSSIVSRNYSSVKAGVWPVADSLVASANSASVSPYQMWPV